MIFYTVYTVDVLSYLLFKSFFPIDYYHSLTLISIYVFCIIYVHMYAAAWGAVYILSMNMYKISAEWVYWVSLFGGGFWLIVLAPWIVAQHFLDQTLSSWMAKLCPLQCMPVESIFDTWVASFIYCWREKLQPKKLAVRLLKWDSRTVSQSMGTGMEMGALYWICLISWLPLL